MDDAVAQSIHELPGFLLLIGGTETFQKDCGFRSIPAMGQWLSSPRSIVLSSGQFRPWRMKMGYSRYDPAMRGRTAWNGGKTVGTKRPLTQKQIWAIRFFLDREERMRDRALFDLAIDSKLRGCDLVKIKIGDIVAGEDVRNRSTVIQQKTGRPVQFELTADVRASLLSWLERRNWTVVDYLFPSRIDHARPMSARQYARLVDEWVTAIGLRKAEYGTHSLRRTKAALNLSSYGQYSRN